jgi:hypothetical protein
MTNTHIQTILDDTRNHWLERLAEVRERYKRPVPIPPITSHDTGNADVPSVPLALSFMG